MKFTGSPTAGDYTIGSGGHYARYRHDGKLIGTDDAYVNWALNWAQKEVAETPTLGEIAVLLQNLKDSGVTLESLLWVAKEKVWWKR